MPRPPLTTPKVLLLTNLFPTRVRPMGGTFIRERVAAHRALGVDITYTPLRMRASLPLRVALSRTGRDPEMPLPEHPNGVTYPLGLRDFARLRRTPDPTRWVARAAESVIGRVADEEFDVVHAHGMFRVPAGAVAREVSRQLGIPYVVSLHGSDINLAMSMRAAHYAEILSNAAASIYVSASLRDRAKELGASCSNAHVIGNGIDPTIFTPGPAERARRMLFVGGLAPVKGADRLPAILRHVLNQVPDVHLDVIGAGGLHHKLAAEAASLPMTLHGPQPREEVARLMRAASVLVVPSRNEGFGCVALEALASGTAVVAANVGGLAEALGGRGTLVPESPAIEEGLATATVQALQWPSRRGELVEYARRHTWEAVARRELNVLRSVTAPGRSWEVDGR